MLLDYSIILRFAFLEWGGSRIEKGWGNIWPIFSLLNLLEGEIEGFFQKMNQ